MTRDSRRLLLLAGVLGLSLLSCGREVTGPGDGLSFGRNRTAALAIDPQFPQLPAGNFASDLVPFVKVRVTIRDLNGAMVRDTTVDFPSAADSIALSITVPLPSSTPAAGLPLTLTMVFVNAAGDTVFRGGPSAITAKPLGAPGASEPIVIPVTWVPPGAVPASVVLTPTTGSVTSGTTTVFRATAFDAVGDSIPNTPIVFAIDTATRATLVVLGGTSTATWLPNPGTVRIIASTLNVRADTSFFVVSLPVPTQLVITAAPTTAVAGTTLSAITVAVRDASNAPTPLFTGSVTLALNAGAIGATLAGTTTVTAVAGIATFSGLSIQRAATGLTLTASSGALTPATSSALAITPAAPAALVALAGDAQSGTLGQPLTDSLDVQLRDAFANPIVGSAIAFSVTTGGGSVSPTSVVTNANGRARARWTLGTAVGVQTARAQLAGVPAVFAAFGATGVPGAPVRLEIVTEPAATQIAGAAIAPAIGVRAVDAVGATVTSFTGTVTLALAANAGATTPTGVLATAAVAGIASFTSIAVTAAGAGYTLAATSGALVPDTTIAFTVLNAAAAQLSTVSGGAQSGTVGATIAAPFVVRVVDGFGNSVPNYAVNWAITGGSGTLTAAATLTNASGNASTTLTLPSLAGLVTVQATAVGVAGSPQSFSATATPGAAAALVLLTVVGPQVAGVPLMGVVVEVRDAVGNVATGFNGVVSGRVFTGPNGPDPDSLPVTAVAGVATFNGGIFDAAGVYTLQFFSVGLPDVFSSSFTVTAAAATQLGLASGAGQTGIAGQPLPLPFAVRIEDPFFNRIPGVTVTWVMVRGVDTLAVNTNVSDANGLAAWQPTLPTSVGPVQLTARSTGLTNSPITLAASVLGDVTTQLTMFTQPVGAVAGVALTANAVRARDQYGNFKTVFNGNVTAAIDSGPAGAVLAGTTTVPAVGGTATFGTLALNLAGTYRLRYSSGGLTSAVSTAFVVTAGAPSSLVVVAGGAQSGTVSSLLTDSIRVRLGDAFGNPIAGTTVDFFISAGGGAATPLVAATNAAGEASTRWTLGTLVGTQQMTVTVPGFPGVQVIVSATASSAAATQLVVTAAAAGAASGAAFTTQPVVAVRNAAGNLVTTDNSSVVTMSVSAGATVVGTATATATGGVAAFATIGLSGPPGAYTLTFSSGGLTVATQAITIAAAAAPLLSWTGAVNNNWGVTGNWSLGRLPLPSDSVFIAPSVADTVEINVSTTVAFLVVSGTAPVLINHTLGATLQVDSVAVFNSNSTFNMSGGSVLTGNGGVQFAGPLNWNGGTMSGTGLSIVAAGATALIASTGAVTLSGRDLVVSGTANIGGSGVGTANFPIITVFPSGTLAFTTAASFFVSASDTLRIVNAGTLRKAASAGTVRIDWTIDNSGLLDVQAGVLDLRNTLTVGGSVIIRTGGSLQSRGHTELNGSLSLENGGNVQFTAGGIAPAPGVHNLNVGSTLSGLGSVIVNGANLVDVRGAFNVDTLTLQNATLAFNSADTAFVTDGAYLGGGFLRGTGVLAIRGAFTTNTGNMNGTGTIAVRPTGTLTLQSPLRGWRIDVQGTLVWGDYDLSFEAEPVSGSFASMNIRSGGVFDIQHAAINRELYGTGFNPLPNNEITVDVGGIIRKSAGTAISNLRPRIFHSGVFDVLAGTINVQGICSVTGGTRTGAGFLTGNCVFP